jgi:acetyl esterase
MKAAGVPVTYVEYPDQIHGFFNMPAISRVCRQAIADAADATRKALG